MSTITAIEVLRKLEQLEGKLVGISRINPSLFHVLRKDVTDLQKRIITTISTDLGVDTAVLLDSSLTEDERDALLQGETQKQKEETQKDLQPDGAVGEADTGQTDGQESQASEQSEVVLAPQTASKFPKFPIKK